MPNTEALERYHELPMPNTTEESWRFTDLRGFDPDSFDHTAVSELATWSKLPGSKPRRSVNRQDSSVVFGIGSAL